MGSAAESRRIESPVEFPPRRVVSLVPSLTETLFDLDLGDRLVAVSDDCTRPAKGVESLIRVGRTLHPDIERIVHSQPDLVLLGDEVNRREDADALRAAGIPVWITGPRTVFDTLNLLWDIMHVFDHAVMVPRVREIERAYDYTQLAAKAMPPLRVFVPVGFDPWTTVNADTFTHDVLCVCGGENVFAGRSARYPAVTPDDIHAAAPDLTLLPDSFPASLGEQAASLGKRVCKIDGALVTWYGTRLAYALRDLPPLLAGSLKDHDDKSEYPGNTV